jgi:HEAT repeat protein
MNRFSLLRLGSTTQAAILSSFLVLLSVVTLPGCGRQWHKATVSELAVALKDGDPEVRARAARELRSRGDAIHEAVPHLIEALGDPEFDVRSAAPWTLSEIQPAPPLAAMPALLRAIREPAYSAGASAVTALGRMGPAAIPGLIESLGLRVSTGSRAAGALAMIGPPAIPPLVEALRKENDGIRQDAAWAFQKMGAGAKPALEHLIKALADSDSFVRQCAAEALGAIGSDAAVAGPELQRLLEDPDEKVREAASTALGQIQAQP